MGRDRDMERWKGKARVRYEEDISKKQEEEEAAEEEEKASRAKERWDRELLL